MLHSLQVHRLEYMVPVFGDEDQTSVQHEATVPVSADVPTCSH